jgi:hypothetical protein
MDSSCLTANEQLNTRAHVIVRSFLRVLPAIFLAILGLGAVGRGSAQQPRGNPRFGIVNADDAPDAAAASGAGWEVITLRWDELQPNGPTDWNADPTLDQYLSVARSQGREVVAVVIGTPQWATSGSAETGVPRGLYLPVADPGNTWAGFMRRAASAYGAQGINRWVIWSDPDIPTRGERSTWEGSIEEYYQLVKVAYLTARESNPNAQIHLGGVGDFDPNWFSRFLEIALDDPTGPANDYYFDVATLHVFFDPEQVYTLMRNHFFVMNQKGIPLKEVWINATNARVGIDPEVYDEDTSFPEHPNISEEQQASFIIQSYALAFAANRGARIAVYRLVDDLRADDDQAFGLLRDEDDPRPAYTAYQLAAEQFNGFVFARRVEEQTHPLIDYVRLTFETKVTHVAWALTEDNATLVIPARTAQATLIDPQGNRWTVEPDGGAYRVVLGGAECNDPQSGCLIGGAPWMLIETGISDAVNDEPPPVTVEEGGEVATPNASLSLTPTAQVEPTEAPTLPPTITPGATEPPATEVISTEEIQTAAEPTESATDEPTQVAEIVDNEPPVEDEGEVEGLSGPELPNPDDLRPRGLAGILPYLLMGLGAAVIGVGVWYAAAGHHRFTAVASDDHLKVTQENERLTFTGEVDEALWETARHDYPEFPEEIDDPYRETQELPSPEFDDEQYPDEEIYGDDAESYDEDQA